MSITSLAKKIGDQKDPVRFLFSRILWHSGLCRFFKIDLGQGLKLYFNPSALSATLWAESSADKGEESFLRNYLKNGDVFVDVGANIGLLTVIAAGAVGEEGKVVSIEPHPKIFGFLRKNIKLNNFSNVEAHNLAVGDKIGELLFSDHKSDEQNMVSTGGSIKVKAVLLDSLVSPDIKKIDLLKIDIEGYELFALKGASSLLARTDAICFESWDRHFGRYGYSPRDVFELLNKNGFRIFKISGNDLLEIGDDYTSKDCENLLAVKDPKTLKERASYLTIVE
ncbi:MAG: FkbM family methyltransferase [Candidatus Paceibacterota bacterium]|jgi:FkbM family methyltransferase